MLFSNSQVEICFERECCRSNILNIPEINLASLIFTDWREFANLTNAPFFSREVNIPVATWTIMSQ